jgi:hypothetical protein
MTPYYNHGIVTAVMLVDGRQELVNRAARCFLSQTHIGSYLLAYDTGSPHVELPDHPRIIHILADRRQQDCIGTLRNEAAEAAHGADILLHWDSDDWSHPLRIEEQVAALALPPYSPAGSVRTPPPDVTGYRDLLFWQTATKRPTKYENGAYLWPGVPGKVVGASMCYRRDTWRNKPFPAVNCGEDTQWQMQMRVNAASSMSRPETVDGTDYEVTFEPRLIAHIHGANSHSHLGPAYKRVADWDSYCAEVMAL